MTAITKEKIAELRALYKQGSPINALYTGTFFDALPDLLDEIERLRASCVPVAGTIDEITKAVRNADMTFEREGGSSRHYVRECLLPSLDDVGLSVVRK